MRHLKEEILEQLGKDVVSFDLQFDVGYYVSSARIHYVNGDNIKEELCRIRDSGKTLWCEGRRNETRCESKSVICLDGDDDCEPTPKKVKVQEKLNAREVKAKTVEEIAVELRETHKDKYNKIQYKLWAEAIDSGKHKSKSSPPAGSIWNNEKAKAVKIKDSSVDTMASAFTKMADSVASAFTVKSQNDRPESTMKENQDSASSLGISPGKKIDYQAKLLSQIDLAHRMFECGAITMDQFEKRRDMLLGQLDSLCQ